MQQQLDRIELTIKPTGSSPAARLSSWKSYSITSDLYCAESAFTFEVADPRGVPDIPECGECVVKTNGSVVLTGIIDKIDDADSKGDSRLAISGRDLMGLVIDEYCEISGTFEGQSIRQMAERLLAPIPYISRKEIVFENGAGSAIVPQAFSQIDPGAKVFDTIRTAAASKGILFYCRPDGRLVFSRPKMSGKPLFALTNRIDGRGNNVETGQRTRDASKRYRTVRVLGQRQGTDSMGEVAAINVDGSANDSTFPLPHKTFVGSFNDLGDESSAGLQAKMILNKQRHDAYSLYYRTSGHSQGGVNWTINEFCRVEDDRRALRETFLVTGRTLACDKTAGTTTLVKLGLRSVS